MPKAMESYEAYAREYVARNEVGIAWCGGLAFVL